MHDEHPVEHLNSMLDWLLIEVGWDPVHSQNQVFVVPIHDSQIDDGDDEENWQTNRILESVPHEEDNLGYPVVEVKRGSFVESHVVLL